jgi:glutamate synthase (NADPH/NADH) small chain
MGIPVWRQGKDAGRVTALEDCMGCARCVVSCPTDALEIRDVRNLFKKSMKQNASYLLKRQPLVDAGRKDASSRLPSERVVDWTEIATKPSLLMIQQQASRCLDCGLPGCSNACPLHNRIPEWLEQVVLGNIQQAAEIAQSTSNLPEICGTVCPQYRLCEGSCTKAKEPGGAVTIGAIERYLVDVALDNNWQPQNIAQNTSQYKGGGNNGKQVAVIGAGPAGLACADELSKAGCEVTVFDKNEKIGGLMETGVPSFKLDKTLLARRKKMLQQQGIRFQLGTEVDEPMLQKLIKDNDAIFLGSGAQTSRDLRLPGQHLEGVADALSYLREVNQHKNSNNMAGKHVLVIGGGDSAMDCARSAIRQNAAEVTIVYRGNEQAMRATPKEKQAAWEEGVRLRLEYAPTEVLGAKHVTGVRFDKVVSGQETISCDAVIFAVGQVNRPQAWMTRLSLNTDQHGIIVVDDDGRTSNPKIYAGGDNTLGPDLVVTAVAAGRCAADDILNSFRPAQRIVQLASDVCRPKQRETVPVFSMTSNSGSVQ